MLFSLIKKHFLLFVFIFIYICFVALTYKDLPIANGEEFRYLRGKETSDHFLYGQFTEKLIQPRPHYFLYSVYTALLVWLNHNFYYEWFHLFNLLFSLPIFVIAYIFTYSYTKNTKYAVFSILALVLFPTFFGQLGFNPIDTPFAVFYLLSLLLIYLFVGSEKRLSGYQILLLGIVLGITQGLRQIGFTIYLILYFYDLYNLRSVIKTTRSRFFDYLLIFVTANFVMLTTWPNFAINYFKNMTWFLFIGQKFYLWDYGLLFMGKFLTNDQRPFYYLPLLQSITSPIYIVLLFLFGLWFLKKLCKNKIYFLLGITFVLNYILYFLLKPVLYDGTRHFLFLVPIIVVLSVIHLHELLTSKARKLYKQLVLGIIIANLFFVAVSMLRAYPYHYVYFNKLGYLFGNPNYIFEADYSSTLYKKSAIWIRDNYVKGDLLPRIYSCDNGYAVDYYSYKKFLTTINRDEADLIICDYKTLLRNDYAGEVIHTDYLNSVPYNFVIKVN